MMSTYFQVEITLPITSIFYAVDILFCGWRIWNVKNHDASNVVVCVCDDYIWLLSILCGQENETISNLIIIILLIYCNHSDGTFACQLINILFWVDCEI